MIDFAKYSSFNEIFTTEFILFAVIFSAMNTALALFLSRKFFHILQQNGYVGRAYSKWAFKRDNIYLSRLFMIAMLSLLSYLLCCTAFSFTGEWVAYFSFAFYALFSILFIVYDFKRKSKSRMVFTSRLIRLYVTAGILYFLITAIIIVGVHTLGYLLRANDIFVKVRFGAVTVMPLFVPIVVRLSNSINSPFERWNNKKYVDECKKTLDGAKDLIRIGITGSYAKTSVKEILRSILSVKYKVLSTPASYNTPMGICKSVKKYDSSDDVFIAEMGARRQGDIKEVAEIVKPTLAVVTGVNGQHLETFGSVDTVKKTKYELIENMSSGIAVFSCDDENTLELYDRCVQGGKVKAVKAGINKDANPDVFAYNIITGTGGCKFDLDIYGNVVKCSSVLLGKHNVSNVCLAAAIAYEAGLTSEEIAEGVSAIRPIKHRLEVVDGRNGVTVIDDSYNSNVNGTKVALEVIGEFSGRKIVITPGLVELGRAGDYENFEFGRRLAKSVDVAILVGDTNSYKIRDGLLHEGFEMEKLIMTKTLDEAVSTYQKMKKDGDVLLFENDLPDKF